MTLPPSPAESGKFVRAFIAVDLGEEVKRGLRPVLAALRRRPCRVRWVAEENLHLTVKFLGEVDGRALGEIGRALAEETALLAPLTLEVHGLQPFPPGRSPRIVAAGVRDEGGGLARLQEALELRMEAFGVPRERRNFRPHLTLGRVQGQGVQAEFWSRLARDAQTAFGTAHVERVILFQSELDPGGARYTMLATAGLQG